MRSLYVKVFAALWLVVMLVVGSNMLLTWMLVRQFEDADTRDSYIEQYAHQALDSYLDLGPQGLRRWQQQLFESTELRTLLLDPQVRNLSGEPLPPRLESLIRRVGQQPAARAEHTDDSHRDKMHRSQRPIIWPIQHQQQNYLFVLLNPRALIDHLYSGRTLFWRLAWSLTLVGLLAWLMARYLVKPIQQLQLASRQLASGQLDTRVTPVLGCRRDEIGQLAQEFDRMAEQIQHLIRGQQQLLRDVSHELRTPLARQRFALELARKKPGSAEALDRIEQQAEELDALIAEILMLARLDSYNGQDPRMPTDLKPLLESLVSEYNVDQPRVKLLSCDSITLNIEPKLIRRALSNIIGNALKYSRDEVQLRLEPHPQELWIRIQDRGPGIDATMLEKIFEPFVRTDQARSRQQGGWGLGLAIAARAVHQHQGQIEAHNLSPQGLEVRIKLPH